MEWGATMAKHVLGPVELDVGKPWRVAIWRRSVVGDWTLETVVGNERGVEESDRAPERAVLVQDQA